MADNRQRRGSARSIGVQPGRWLLAGCLVLGSIRCLAAVTEGEDIRDIRPPVPIPTGWEWFGWLLAALAACVLVYLLIRHWRRHRQRPAVVPAIPPHVRARNRLMEALGSINRPEPFCVLISDALRLYLEERFEWHAPERTTEEFLDELRASPRLTVDQEISLSDFLTRCDLVKFARHQPAEPELRELFESALRLVDQTVPESEPPNASKQRAVAVTGDDQEPGAVPS
jgi:hypothetical protein